MTTDKKQPGRRAGLLASAATPAPVVTTAGVRETITLEGREYVLAAPTLAEVGQHLADQARDGGPTADELTEAYRAALNASGEGDGVLAAFEEAEDAWVSFTSIHVVTGPDATESIQAEAVGLHRTLLKARRERDRSLVKLSRDPGVLDIRAKQQEAQWSEFCRLVALLCRGWKGEGLPAFPAALDRHAVEKHLPMGDVVALARRAMALMQPTAEAGKA